MSLVDEKLIFVELFIYLIGIGGCCCTFISLQLFVMSKKFYLLSFALLSALSGVNAQCVITDEVRIAAGTMAAPFASCGDVVTYQGYEYATVQIGDQCWFAENLQSENYENGEAIPSNLSDSEWSSTTSGAVAVYGDNALNLETYGRLYNWYAVDDARGLCPSGWHVPTDAEWTALRDHLLQFGNAGDQLKATSGWDSGGNGDNSSGFTGLPHGYREAIGGAFGGVGIDAAYWSSSADGTEDAWYRTLYYTYSDLQRYSNDIRFGMAIRCLGDSQ